MEYTYGELGWRTPLVVVCILVNIVLSLASSALVMAFDESNPSVSVALLLVPTSLGGVAAFIASIVAVCLWTHRANSNAHALTGDWVAPSLTPGSAVGSYFIPFVNLVRPYSAMREIDSASLGEPSTDPMLGAWWGTWVVGNILSNIGFRMDSPEADLGGAAVHFVCGILLVLIVRRIDAAQKKRHADLRRVGAPSIASFRDAPVPVSDPGSP